MSVLRGVLLAAALGLNVIPGAANASTPSLSSQNFFEAVGSAQQVFDLPFDAVLRTYAQDEVGTENKFLHEDAMLRTTGSWAALVIQNLSVPYEATMSFVAFTDACRNRRAACEQYEFDYAATTKRLEGPDDPTKSGNYLLPAGRYAVGIMAEPGARTTAALSLHPSAPSLEDSVAAFAARRVGPIAGQAHLVDQATDAQLRATQKSEVLSDGWEGTLERSLLSEGLLIGGLRHTLTPMGEGNEAHYVSSNCLTSRDGADRSCMNARSKTWCVCPVVTQGHSRSPWQSRTVPAGAVSWEWEIEAETRMSTAESWMLAWPYVTE